MNPGPVLRCELDSKVILANAAARQVFGNELVGLRWRDCVAGIDNAMWNRIMQGTEPIYLEARSVSASIVLPIVGTTMGVWSLYLVQTSHSRSRRSGPCASRKEWQPWERWQRGWRTS